MFKIWLSTLLLLFTCYCFGQKNKDQPLPHLNLPEADSIRLKKAFETGDYYQNKNRDKTNLDSAIVWYKKALTQALAAHNEKTALNAQKAISKVYLKLNDLPTAEQYCTLTANYYKARHDTAGEAVTWIFFGNDILDVKGRGSKKEAEEAPLIAGTYFDRAKAVVQYMSDTAAVIKIWNKAASAYGNWGYFTYVRKAHLATINKFHNSRFLQISKLYSGLSEVYRDEGNSNRSLFYMMKALKELHRLKDTTNKQIIYGELALVYEELGQTDSCIRWYKKALAAREHIAASTEASLYRTAGFLIQNLNKQGKSAEGLLIISGLEKRHPPLSEDGRGMIAQVKAYCYEGLKQYDLAEKEYLQMMYHFKDTQAPYLINLAKYDIVCFYVAQKAYKKAEFYLNSVQNISYNLARRKTIQLMLFKVDSAAGRSFTAIKHYQQYKLLNDSIFNIAKSKQIEELQIQYATEQKEDDLKSLKKDRQLQHEQINHANNARNITFVGIGLLLIVVGLLYNSYRINRKRSQEIDLKNTALNQLLSDKDSLLDEKEWLIKEVHHRVKNNLQIVMGLLQRQSAFINNKEALTAIQNSEHRMHSVALIHQKLYQSANFTMVNMADYIDEMVGYLRDSFDLGSRFTFEKDIEAIELEINLAVPLGLILNEAITNAIKYAFPTHEQGCIQINFTRAGNNNILQIADNGRGLPADFDVQKINSMGFNLMRGLSKQLGGSFNVVSDKGVNIVINFKAEPSLR